MCILYTGIFFGMSQLTCQQVILHLNFDEPLNFLLTLQYVYKYEYSRLLYYKPHKQLALLL